MRRALRLVQGHSAHQKDIVPASGKPDLHPHLEACAELLIDSAKPQRIPILEPREGGHSVEASTA